MSETVWACLVSKGLHMHTAWVLALLQGVRARLKRQRESLVIIDYAAM